MEDGDENANTTVSSHRNIKAYLAQFYAITFENNKERSYVLVGKMNKNKISLLHSELKASHAASGWVSSGESALADSSP